MSLWHCAQVSLIETFAMLPSTENLDIGLWQSLHDSPLRWCTDPSQCKANNTDSFTGKRYTGGDRNLKDNLDDGQLTEAAFFAVHVLLSTPLARGGYGCLPPLPDLPRTTSRARP